MVALLASDAGHSITGAILNVDGGTCPSQALVPPNLRACTSASVVCSAGFFGTVLGPFCTGYLSDVLASHGAGAASLRYAIQASGLVGAGLLIVGSRRLSVAS